MAMAFSFGVYGIKDPPLPRGWWLIPLRDAFEFLIWAVALFSNQVAWRESKFYVRRGRLILVRPPSVTKPLLATDRSRASANPGRCIGLSLSQG